MVFLRRESAAPAGLRAISAASGAARVMANALNLLAHEAVGLDAAVALSQAVPCFELDVTDLEGAVGGVKDLLCQFPATMASSRERTAASLGTGDQA